MESKWFEKKIPKIKRTIHIPRYIAKNLKLGKYDKIAVKIKNNGKMVIFPTRVLTTMTKTGMSCMFNVTREFRMYFDSTKITMKIVKLRYISSFRKRENKLMGLHEIVDSHKKLSVTEWIEPSYLVIWHESGSNRPCDPTIISKKIEINDKLARYVGLYHAEGNKIQHFRIYATTKNLAKLVVNSYDKIIKNSNLTITINFDKSINDKRSNYKIERILHNYWKNIIKPYRIKNVRITTRRPNAIRDPEKHAEFGTLEIRDSRILPRILHVWLVGKIYEQGLKRKRIIQNLLYGICLGDSAVAIRLPPRKPALQHIEIGTNKEEAKFLEDVCKSLNLNYEKQVRKGNDVRIRIKNYCNLVLYLNNGFLREFPKKQKKLIKGIENRIETYILKTLLASSNHSAFFKGKFGMKASSYLVRNKRNELIFNRFITFDGKIVTLTQKGLKFIKYLKKIKI